MIATKKLTDIPESLRILSQQVDNTDAKAVYETVNDTVAKLREGRGPVFIEAITERWPGSVPLWPELIPGATDMTMAWDETKITGEHAGWIRKHDPVLRFARDLIADTVLTQAEVLAIDKRVNERLETARSFAIASPLPKPESAIEGVFA